jgi:hypothetical protein
MKLARAWGEDLEVGIVFDLTAPGCSTGGISTLPLYLGSKKGAIISNKRGREWKPPFGVNSMMILVVVSHPPSHPLYMWKRTDDELESDAGLRCEWGHFLYKPCKDQNYSGEEFRVEFYQAAEDCCFESISWRYFFPLPKGSR